MRNEGTSGVGEVRRWVCVSLLSIFCFSFFLPSAQAQGRPRSWKKGLLRQDDFGASAFDGRHRSHLEYAVVYDLSGVSEGMNSYLYCRTAAVMYPSASWMVEEYRSDSELDYNQVLFDMVEVYRRQMQYQSVLLSKKKQYEYLLASTMNQLEREIQVMQAVTDYGRDSAAVEQVRLKNRQWLNEHPGRRPQFTPRLFWWGASMDFGVAIPTGGLAQNFSASVGMMGFSLGFGWGRHGFYYHSASGDIHYRNVEDEAFRNMLATRIDVTFGYGFTVIDRPLYGITPYLALGATDFDWYYGSNYTAGVMGRYHFHHWHSIKNWMKNKGSCLTVSAIGNLYVSYIDMYDETSSLTLGLRLGLSFQRRDERVEW